MSDPRKRITIIGSGKVAWSLIPALQEISMTPEFILSKDPADAKEAADAFRIPRYSADLKDIPQDSDIYLILVPDDIIAGISDSLADQIKDITGKSFIHFSGVLSSAVMEKIISRGGTAASLHIMQTFPSKDRIPVKDSYAAIDSSDKNGELLLTELAAKLGLNYFVIDSASKTEYHLSGVFASNFIVANLFAAEEMFNRTGSGVNFYEFILPIVKRSLENSANKGALNAISGPVERGDINTVLMHIESLKEDAVLLRSYIAQSLAVIDMKRKNGTFTSAHAELSAMLMKKLKSLEI